MSIDSSSLVSIDSEQFSLNRLEEFATFVVFVHNLDDCGCYFLGSYGDTLTIRMYLTA